VVLIAVMVDRRAITFRTLAIAALTVLAIAPEALVHPSFQMSFAATLGLVALIANGLPTLFARADNSLASRVAMWGGREVVTLTLASTIAGLATMPYAAFHFHRVTPYGVLANLAAMPVVSAVVMPAGILGLLAMPFGLDGVFWRLMDWGIAWMIAVSQWVAALPGAIGRMPAFGTGPLLCATAGMIVLGLLRTPLRWAGIAVISLAVAWALATPKPDVLISADGRNVALRGADGRLHLMRTGKDAFLLKEWLAADADGRAADDPSLTEGVSCDDAGCVGATRDGALVSLALRPDAFADDCGRTRLLVARAQPPADCAARVIDWSQLRRLGALALRWRTGGFMVEAERSAGRDRPWSPGSALPEPDVNPDLTPGELLQP
jgi:competence protein ComEC